MQRPDVDGLKALHEAATPGPWRFQAVAGQVELHAPQYGGTTIMAVMDEDGCATIAFLDSDNILKDAEEFFRAEPGREHHTWFRRIDHPDANIIPEARNALPELIAYIEHLESSREQEIAITLRVEDLLPGFARYQPGDKLVTISLKNCAGFAELDGIEFDKFVKDCLVHELTHAVQDAYGQMFSETQIMQAQADPAEMVIAEDDAQAEELRLENEMRLLDQIKALEAQNAALADALESIASEETPYRFRMDPLDRAQTVIFEIRTKARAALEAHKKGQPHD